MSPKPRIRRTPAQMRTRAGALVTLVNRGLVDGATREDQEAAIQAARGLARELAWHVMTGDTPPAAGPA